jgi:hypothetical protein
VPAREVEGAAHVLSPKDLAVTAIDYDATVTLMVHDRATLIPAVSRTTTLAEAVQTVVDKWMDPERAEIYLATDAGPITSLAEVQAIYTRADFPRA